MAVAQAHERRRAIWLEGEGDASGWIPCRSGLSWSIGAVLAAVAGGAGGALGSQVWAGLSALVRRPFRHVRAIGDGAVPLSSGSAELAALQDSPADERRAAALAEVLVARADIDSEFRDALHAWWEQAGQIRIEGDVTNTVSGGTQHGPVLQGRDFSGLTFGSAIEPRPAPAPPDRGPVHDAVRGVIEHLADHLAPDPRVIASLDLDQDGHRLLVDEEVIKRPAAAASFLIRTPASRFTSSQRRGEPAS